MEQTVIVTDVDSGDVDILWPKIKGHLESALNQGQGEYSIEDIYLKLISESMRLWILYNTEGELLSSAVCEMIQYPQKKVCYVTLTGGDSIDHWSYAMTAIEEWAAENGADTVRAYVRRGILKVLKDNQFNEVYTVVQKELSARRLH